MTLIKYLSRIYFDKLSHLSNCWNTLGHCACVAVCTHKVHTHVLTPDTHTICILPHVLFFKLRSVITDMTRGKSDLSILRRLLVVLPARKPCSRRLHAQLLCPFALSELLMTLNIAHWQPLLSPVRSLPPHPYFMYLWNALWSSHPLCATFPTAHGCFE